MSKFKTLCGDCGLRVEREFVARPLVCFHCGSEFFAAKEMTIAPSEDTVARVIKLANDGLSFDSLLKSFEIDAQTLMDILAGKFGKGKLQPQYVPVSERVMQWMEDQRRKKALP